VTELNLDEHFSQVLPEGDPALIGHPALAHADVARSGPWSPLFQPLLDLLRFLQQQPTQLLAGHHSIALLKPQRSPPRRRDHQPCHTVLDRLCGYATHPIGR